MSPRLFTIPVLTTLTTLCCLTPLTARAQIVPDNTLGSENSVVTPNVNIRGIPSDRIDGGAVRGGNLFHSFQEFNVEVGRGSYFSNPDNIINILTRVTGGNISEIMGTLGVLGNANLFLINPNGIVFGPNARLDVGGSFFATTADSILFENGVKFAASNPEAPPLLTINMPLGLNIRENPGSIVNQAQPKLVRSDNNPLRNDAGFLIPQGLNVPQNQTLALVGGEVIFDNGVVISPGSNIELGGLSEPGIVQLNYDGSLSFPDNTQRANIGLINESQINSRADGGGDVNINGRNIEISGGSIIRAGIDPGFGSPEAKGGEVNINAQENVLITGAGSSIRNVVDVDGIGQTGDTTITAQSLLMDDSAFLITSLFGQGTGGSVFISAIDSVQLSSSNIFNDIQNNAVGNGGNIYIKAQQIDLSDALITGDGFGTGNIGNFTINTGNLVVREGTDIRLGTAEGAIGSTGNLMINASESIEVVGRGVNNSSRINTRTDGSGNAGSIVINTPRLIVRDGGTIFTASFSDGEVGGIVINAPESVFVQGAGVVERNGMLELAFSDISTGNSGGEGVAGDIFITTDKLTLQAGGTIGTSTLGSGRVGSVNIQANTVELSGQLELGESFSESEISILAVGRGTGGTLKLEAERLTIQDGGAISVTTLGTGSIGSMEIQASEINLIGGGRFPSQISLSSGLTSFDESFLSGLSEDVVAELLESENLGGSTGNLTIETEQLRLLNGAQIDSIALGGGSSGTIEIYANSIEIAGSNSFVLPSGETLDFGSDLRIQTEATGQTGSLIIDTNRLVVRNRGVIAASSSGIDDGGSINIQAQQIEFNNQAFISTGTSGTGSGGDITIQTERLSILNDSRIFSGINQIENPDNSPIVPSINRQGGTISIQASELIEVTGVGSSIINSVDNDVIGTGGNIILETGNLIVGNEANIFTNTEGIGNAGEIDVQAETVALTGGSALLAGVTEGGIGNGGTVTINASQIRISDEASIVTGTDSQGNAGNINLQAENIELSGRNSGLIASILEGGVGDGGTVTLNAEQLSVRDGAFISVATAGIGNAGTVNVQATDLELAGRNSETGFVSNIAAFVNDTGVGDAGTVTIDVENLTIRDGSVIAVSSSGLGNPGNVDVNASQVRIENQAGLAAASITGQGGNVTINSPDIRLRQNGEISASGSESSQTFDGNIEINTNLLILLEESSIFTSAFDPTGGSNITIRPLGNSGLGVLQSQNSIISAAGELSIDETLNFDPPEVPEVNVVDPATLIAQDPCKQGQESEFIITGRGGIAPNLTEDLPTIQGLAELELIEPVTPQGNNSSTRRQQRSRKRENNRDNHPVDSRTIIPARGWIRTPEGEVILVGYDPTKTGVQRQPQQVQNQCHSEE